MKAKSCLLAALALFFYGCPKRKYPPSQVFTDKEVIRMTATVDNEPVDLRAGANSYYCYSTCRQGSDGVYRFAGSLRKYECNPCPSSFYFEVNDLRPRPTGSHAWVDSVITTGNYQFSPVGSHRNSFRFTPSFNVPAASYSWNFGDGTTSSISSPLHTYSKPGLYNVCMKATSVGGCENTACSQVAVLDGGNILFAGITVSSRAGTSATFAANVTGAAESYTWHFGDGSTAEGATSSHTYAWPGGYPVKLVVKDTEGNVVEATCNFVSGQDPSSCAANFSVSNEGLEILSLSKVRIVWTDKDNRLCTSDNVTQTSESYLEVLDVSDFGTNESGVPTKLVHMKFNALLSDGTRAFWFKSDDATIAIGYN